MARRRIHVAGVVQGVGFRPFVYALARKHGLTGFVLNDGSGVLIEAEGDAGVLDSFTHALRADAPPLARVDVIASEPIPAGTDSAFVIRESAATGKSALIPADVATCDVTALIRAVHDDHTAGRPRSEIAAAFHETVAAAAADACAEAAEPRLVVLSGGSFQNLRLLESTRRRLEAHGFRVLTHRLVPPNDGGISYGQAAVAAATPPAKLRLPER